ncbi:hypothetical protein ACFY19_32345 [Streptosporangium saharense]|uniref:hypothetical protein n=1 Tax=Streptosporangium saharense TaxID=1706840 RepID=UPI00368EEAAE
MSHPDGLLVHEEARTHPEGSVLAVGGLIVAVGDVRTVDWAGDGMCVPREPASAVPATPPRCWTAWSGYG